MQTQIDLAFLICDGGTRGLGSPLDPRANLRSTNSFTKGREPQIDADANRLSNPHL